MSLPDRRVAVWLSLMAAGALPTAARVALSQTTTTPSSIVLLTPRAAVADTVRERPLGLVGRPWIGSSTSAATAHTAYTYKGPNLWVAAPIGLAWLITIDASVKEWSQTSWQGEVGDQVARLGDYLGEEQIMIFVAGGSLFVGAFDGAPGLERASAVITGILAGPMVNAVIKYVTGRTRPNATDNPLDWHPFSGEKSFPSGHVSVPFSIGGALDAATGSPAVAYPFYLAGALTGFARIYDNAHWFSDVVASAIIASIVSRKATHLVLDAWGLEPGLGSGRDVDDPVDARLRYRRPTGIHASLIATSSRLGVSLTF